MARKKKEESWELDDLFSNFASGLSNAAKKPNNLMYKPDPQQMPFHASEKKGKLYIGGNRSGKTTGGINEDIFWLRGQHPFRKVPPPPVIGRLCTVDFKNGLNKIILPNLRQWIPPSLLINGSWEDSWNGHDHILTLSNDSELEIMSYDQDLDKFAGVPRHFIHFDEEPTKDIFDECKLRLIDYDGSWWITMTPIDGMTWVHTDIFEPSDGGKNRLIEVIHASPYNNSHLSEQAIDEIMEGLDDNGRKIRGHGTFVAIGGLVFKHFDPNEHVIPAQIPPASWQHYISLDSGYNNPTAVLWHGVSPNEDILTYDEIYVREHTVAQVAALIKEKVNHYRETYGIVPFLYVADPAIKQRNVVTGLSVQIEYAQLGINFATPHSRDVNAGLDKMIEYQRIGKWKITENCPNIQKEMRTYARERYATAKLREKNNNKESPQKKDDHALDSSRYFFSFMPTLNPQEAKQPGVDLATLMGESARPVPRGNVDRNLIDSNPSDDPVFITEIGEF